MNGIKVLSLGYAVPGQSASQDQALEIMGWKSRLARTIFKNAAIDKRHVYVPFHRMVQGLSHQELTEFYEEGAVKLGVEAAEQALEGIDRDDIGNIVFASVTGYTCPSLSYKIASELGLRKNVVHSDLLGMGCEAAAPAMERAYDHVRVHEESKALAISSEICSATWFPADESDLDYLVSSAIFGDAASAAVIGINDDDDYYPFIIDFESYFDPDNINLLGYKWEQGRLKVVLSREVPNIVPPLMKQAVCAMLVRNHLALEDISHWIIHPGGKAVLENVEKELGLTREQTKWSWEVMRQFGNVSSATVGIIAKFVQQYENPKGWGVMVTMGAGTAVNCALVRW